MGLSTMHVYCFLLNCVHCAGYVFRLPLAHRNGCAPALLPNVAQAYEAAILQGKTSYTDPVTGYSAFTEASLTARTCCGNK